ncbi:hypothetical protein A2Z00_05650 [Candidatus Gottesmanbacteria bacterium RBG_13_45_10]|uniref:Uncharacterized protein n=1 Tax=Candidatus Gottesmanbacteria bacterium RBG_13_45_10 TaxID=1798370 RepID=A0A1F5ZH44_9BACT|nr:MAG: hypothetical protein A2Z00_05650 [Candidatus Gottesmanbacteria bacterium RBG_13_45_10]
MLFSYVKCDNTFFGLLYGTTLLILGIHGNTTYLNEETSLADEADVSSTSVLHHETPGLSIAAGITRVGEANYHYLEPSMALNYAVLAKNTLKCNEKR